MCDGLKTFLCNPRRNEAPQYSASIPSAVANLPKSGIGLLRTILKACSLILGQCFNYTRSDESDYQNLL